MALVISEPTAEATDNSDGTSYAPLAAYTPTANALQVVCVTAAGTTAVATMTGGSLTWTLRHSRASGAGTTVYIFTAQAGSSPASCDPTFDCTGDGSTGVTMAVLEVTGHNQSSPIVQVGDGAANAANPVATMAGAFSTNNAYIGAVGVNRTAPAYTQPGSWTKSAETGHTTPNSGMHVAYRVNGETGTTATWTGASGNHAVVVIEIAVESSSSPGSSTGSSTAAGVGASLAVAPGASAGVATASGVGASVANSVGASDGTAAASGVGASIANSVGASDGAATALGVGASLADAVGSSSGTGGASGASAANSEAVGASAGVATVDGVGDYSSTAGSVGASSGSSTVLGVGASASAAVGASSGVGAASGVGDYSSTETADTHDGADDISESEARAYLKKRKERRAKEEAKARATEQAARKPSATFDTPEPTEQTPNQAPLAPFAPFDTPDYSAHLALLAEIERLSANLGALNAARFLAAEQALADEIRARAAQDTATAILALVAEHESDEDDEEDLILLMSI